MMQLLPEQLRERTPVIPAVRQVQVPDLIDLDRGRARTSVHAEVRKAEVFLDGPLGEAKVPALLMGQPLLKGKVRLLRTDGDGEEGPMIVDGDGPIDRCTKHVSGHTGGSTP